MDGVGARRAASLPGCWKTSRGGRAYALKRYGAHARCKAQASEKPRRTI